MTRKIRTKSKPSVALVIVGSFFTFNGYTLFLHIGFMEG